MSAIQDHRVSRNGQNVWKKHLRRNRQKILSTALAVFIIVSTVLPLIMPAFTLDASVYCGKEEHTHTDACYTVEKELTCGLEEGQETTVLVPHVHMDECYTYVEVELSAEPARGASAEGEQDTSDAEPAETEPAEEQPTEAQPSEKQPAEPEKIRVLSCGLEEGELVPVTEIHHHSESCYTETKVLTCGKVEHTHSEMCYSNQKAGVETAEDWKAMFASVKLSGDWSKDLVTIAKTQLGYHDKTENFTIDADGTKTYYSRYGAWYGIPYGDWCAMFVSFCLNYAKIPQTTVPWAAGCTDWMETFKQKGLFKEVTSGYEPQLGDLVFFRLPESQTVLRGGK